MARIGIFGGSFNPPHRGHILALREFYEKLNLDRVLVIPAANPPHKRLTTNSASADARLEMTRLAVRELPWAEVLDLELRREGLSYTADTLDALREQFPEEELFLLMGTDMFLSFASWYAPERITAQATLAVAFRDGKGSEMVAQTVELLKERFGAAAVPVRNVYLPYSSTGVRAMLAFDAAEEYLDPAVLDYIRRNGLYFVGENLRNLPFERLQEVSLSLHKPSRVAHVVGCSETAALLARHYGEDPELARRGGILHDITKALQPEEQLKLCSRYGMILSTFEQEHPKLLHAKTGALVAKEVFGELPAVVQAIAWHTTGRAGMTTMEKILYLADYIEPNRRIDGVEELRNLTWSSLDAGMCCGLEMSMAHVRSRGQEIDPHSGAALRYLEERNP